MNLDRELDALTINLKADSSIVYVTQRQVGGLNGLISMGLEDKSPETRHAVIALLAGQAMKDIAGVKVLSAKNLTAAVAKFLINLLKEDDSTPWRLSPYGRELIKQAETRVKTQAIY